MHFQRPGMTSEAAASLPWAPRRAPPKPPPTMRNFLFLLRLRKKLPPPPPPRLRSSMFFFFQQRHRPSRPTRDVSPPPLSPFRGETFPSSSRNTSITRPFSPFSKTPQHCQPSIFSASRFVRQKAARCECSSLDRVYVYSVLPPPPLAPRKLNTTARILYGLPFLVVFRPAGGPCKPTNGLRSERTKGRKAGAPLSSLSPLPPLPLCRAE